MKTIKFTDKEIDFLRNQYEMELEEAEKYIESIRNILDKLGSPVSKKVIEPIEKSPKKRGRKPRLENEEVVTEVIKKQRKSRVVKAQPVKQEEPKVEKVTTPIPVKKTRKPRVVKEKPVKLEEPKVEKGTNSIPVKKARKKRLVKVKPEKQKKSKVGKNTTTIPVKKERKPRSDIGKARAKPVKPVSKDEVVQQPIPIVLEQIISSLREKKEEEVVPSPTAIEPKPVPQAPKPNTNFKKKKFRPKRPRIMLTNLRKPLALKGDIETPKTEINPDRVD